MRKMVRQLYMRKDQGFRGEREMGGPVRKGWSTSGEVLKWQAVPE